MTTDPLAMRERLAKEVMGFAVLHSFHDGGMCIENGGSHICNWQPDKDIAQAFMCLEKRCKVKGNWYRIQSGDGYDCMDYEVEIFLKDKKYSAMTPMIAEDGTDIESLEQTITSAIIASMGEKG